MMDYYQNPKIQSKSAVKDLNTNVVLYIGELPPDIDQYELHQFITSFGKFNVESLIVKPTKENKSYAYVKFKSKTEVEKAKKALHLQTIRNYVIKAEPFRKKEYNTATSLSNLFVKNLSESTTPKDVYELFSKCGKIISVKLKQNEKGECLGYGYVNYENSDFAEEALKNFNDFELKGKKLSVSKFSSKSERQIPDDEEKFPLILIKQLPKCLNTEKSLNDIFSKFGQISVCGIVSGVNDKNKEVSDSLDPDVIDKIGMVLFHRKEDAADAVDSLNNTIIDDSGIPILLSQAPIDKETIEKLWKAKQETFKTKYDGCNLVVKNIPKEISEKNLFEICKKYGDVAGARIATEGKMREIKNEFGQVIDKEFIYESKGYGFVLFRNALDAKVAKENLSSGKVVFKNMTLNLIVEYYDYSKQEKREPNSNSSSYNNSHVKPFKLLNSPKKHFKNYNQNDNKGNYNYQRAQNIYRDKNRNNQNENSNENDQSLIINNRTIVNPKPNNFNKVNSINNNRNFNSNNPHHKNQQMPQMNQNPFMNPNMFMNINTNNTQNLKNHGHISNLHNSNPLMSQQMNQINSQMSQINPFGGHNHDVEFLKEIINILKNPNSTEKTDQLGEIIFYHLLRFISKYNLNNSNGRFDDPTLCSKLTGMFLSIDEKDLLEILSNNDILNMTIKDVVKQLLTIETLK